MYIDVGVDGLNFKGRCGSMDGTMTTAEVKTYSHFFYFI